MRTHKQIAKKYKISLATAYRVFPVKKPQVTQADVLLLRLHGMSIRQIATVLSISKDMVWRYLR